MERGDRIDGCFWIERCIHRSATMDVYRAVDVRDSSAVVLRVLSDLSSAGVEHFESTCATLAGHPHPALERVVASGALGPGVRYAALEMPNGPTLEEMVSHGSKPDILRITVRVLEALGHLHTLGLSHGDLGARAVLVPHGSANATTLADVTLVPPALIASETSMPSMQSDPASHLSPERVRATTGPSAQSDIFALGCVIHRLLTGKLPFAAATIVGTWLRVLYEEPERVSCADRELAQLATLAHRMMAKDPALRPTAREALRDLDPQGLHESRDTAPDGRGPRERIKELGLILCRGHERTSASLASEGELDRVQRLLDDVEGRLDRLSDGTLLVEVPSSARSGEQGDGLVRAGKAALLLQAALPLGSVVVARGGSDARNLDEADALLSRIPRGKIGLVPDVVARLDAHFEVEAGDPALLWEREPRTREHRPRPSERASPGPRADVKIPDLSRAAVSFLDLDTEITIIEQKRPTLEIEVPPGALEPQATIEMDLTALALLASERSSSRPPPEADAEPGLDDITLDIPRKRS